MLLLLTVFLAVVNADCSNKASWGCDKIENTDTDCYGAAAKFCGVCKPECQNEGSGEDEATPEPETCEPKETTCKVCTSDMDCEGKLFSITKYGEGKSGRFGCTYAEDYEYVNESEECPRGQVIVKKDDECGSDDDYVGIYSTMEECAAAVAKEGGRFFIYGKSWKSGGCYKEHMKTAECKDGWESDKYFDVYENIVCKDDEEAVKAALFDDNANCKNTIATYASYGQDLCAPDSEFLGKCCETCAKELAVGDMCESFCSYEGLSAEQKARCEDQWCGVREEEKVGKFVVANYGGCTTNQMNNYCYVDDDTWNCMCPLLPGRKNAETALAALPTCTCSGGNEQGTNNGDKVCEWSGGNCSKFREGCPGACIMQKDAESALAALPTCTCSGGNQQGTNNGDKVCEWSGGNCSKFREGCSGACIMQKETEVGSQWNFPTSGCPYPSCRMHCEHGFEKDANGCDTCWCATSKANSMANVSYTRTNFGIVEGFAVLGFAALVYGAFKHYIK